MSRIVLPKFLCPKHETDLVRLGKKNDGGYAIPKKSFKNSDFLYSFGLNDDFSFEEQFYANSKSKIICYDHAVSYKFFIKNFLLGDFKSFIKYFNHIKFFNGNDKIHKKKYIAPVGTYNTYFKKEDIEDLNLILQNPTSKNLFLKIDIEGSEYRIFDQLIKYSQYMTGLVMEIHDCDLNIIKIRHFIENIKLDLVHIHVNHSDFVSPSKFPRALELTFSPNEYNKILDDNDKKFPIDLDQPNNPNFPDLPIEFVD